METSQASLATESFSYSWLVGPKPASPDLREDPPLTHNFTFDVSISTDDHHHAENLFSNGFLMPVFDTTNTNHAISTSPAPISSSSSSSSNIFPTKFSRISRKILHKYFGFLLSCYASGAGVGQRRRSKRVDDLSRRAQEVKSLTTTPDTVSPRMSTASAYSTWSDCAESSIYEAILYCKRSSEQ